MLNKKQSGIKQMWEFKVEVAKYVRYLNDNIIPTELSKEVEKDWLYSHITKVITDTINDFYIK
jgi:hypothetical protein